MATRRNESFLRLETLGRLSGYYSDVASGNSHSDDDKSSGIDKRRSSSCGWEVESNSSHTSTNATVFDKLTPPGVITSRTTHQVTSASRPGTSSSHDRAALRDTLLKGQPPHVSALDGPRRPSMPTVSPSPAPPETPSIPQRSHARDRHPTILRPAQRPASGFANDPAMRRTAYSAFEPHRPAYRAQRPSSVYSGSYLPYQPDAAPCRQKSTTRTEIIDLYADSSSSDGDARSEISPYGTAEKEVWLQRPTSPVKRAVASSSSSSSHPANRGRQLARGRGTHLPPPSSSPLPERCPSPAKPSHSPSRSRSRSPSPGYGAWHPDNTHARRPSFSDRAHEAWEAFKRDQLQKAGYAPPPSFAVKRVTRSPVMGAPGWNQPGVSEGSRGEGKGKGRKEERLPFSMRMRQRQQREQQRGVGGVGSSPAAGAKAYGPARTAALSELPGSGANVAANASTCAGGSRRWSAARRDQDQGSELFVRTDVRGSGLLEPEWTTTTHAVRRSEAPGPRLETKTAELEASGIYEMALPANAVSPPASAPLVRTDSLHLGGLGDKLPQNPAGHSFFASEYAQRRVSAMMMMDEEEENATAQAGPASSRGGRGSGALSGEQLQLASPPSGLDLGQPLDDRRALPSQTRTALQRGYPKQRAACRWQEEEQGRREQLQQQQQRESRFYGQAQPAQMSESLVWGGTRTLSRKKATMTLR
ncbi:hypothetical protein F5Y15DRAFT_424862 [Xylariaceae sp. FL0016]|nr:hypothetical protein F5Y15DRAFT_424862 [Xylariaceae sp. FL0016]